MRKIKKLLLSAVSVVLAAAFFITPAVAEEASYGPITFPEISADVLEITGEEPFIELLYYETMARGIEAVSILYCYGYTRDNIANELVQLGFNVTPVGRYQTMTLPPVPESADQTTSGSVTEAEAEHFKSRLNSLLGGISSPADAEAAQAYEAQIMAEVDSWLSTFRSQVEQMKQENPRPFYHIGTITDGNGTLREIYSYRNAGLINVNLEIHDFGADSQYLMDLAESIKNAPTLEEARNRVQLFYDEATAIQAEAAGFGPEIETAVRAAFNEWAGKFQSRFELDLRNYGETLGAQKALKLAEQAKAEAVAAKNEIMSRLIEEIQEEMKGQAGAGPLGPADIQRLMQLGFQIGMSRGASEGMAVKAQLEAKYYELAQQSRTEVTALIETMAAEGKAWIEQEFSRIGGQFARIQEDAEAMFRDSYPDVADSWRNYADNLRHRIVVEILDHHMKNAWNTVEGYRAEIDTAYAAGLIDTNTDQLLNRLSSDRSELVAEFTAAGDDMALIATIAARYQQTWREIRVTLEKARYQGTQLVLDTLAEKVPWDKVREAARYALNTANMVVEQEALWQDFVENPNPRWVSWFPCYVERGLEVRRQMWGSITEIVGRYSSQAETIMEIIDRYESMQENAGSYTVDDALALKDDFVREWTETFVPASNEFTYKMRLYNDQMSTIMKECKAEAEAAE